jgi:hypothetical protein
MVPELYGKERHPHGVAEALRLYPVNSRVSVVKLLI